MLRFEKRQNLLIVLSLNPYSHTDRLPGAKTINENLTQGNPSQDIMIGDGTGTLD